MLNSRSAEPRNCQRMFPSLASSRVLEELPDDAVLMSHEIADQAFVSLRNIAMHCYGTSAQAFQSRARTI